MILPLFVVLVWTSAITCISLLYHNIGINPLLLTVLGFVVALSLSFRSSTAYERYNDGRKYWAQLTLATQSLARLVWIHADERPESEVEDLLAKVSFCNLLVTFCIALKHRLRFEPYTHYDDLQFRLKHLYTLAHSAKPRDWDEPSNWKLIGLLLGLPMAEDNPRKLMKGSTKPLGNIPLELLSASSAYIKTIINNGTFKTPFYQAQSLTLIAQMNDALTGTERVLNTPLPLAYSIAISQITWVYILILPFQLVKALKWVTIPATFFAAYIILGIALIGSEVENPFGYDVNDLPLDHFCEQIRHDIEVIMSQPAPTDFEKHEDNAILYPLSQHGYEALRKTKTVREIRDLLRSKADLTTAKN
ncbi:hypothetical protein PWT90_11192 [Aphanocladium album]|nr:hypothetical protein PWT90_11192 [Aphanocladium album]